MGKMMGNTVKNPARVLRDVAMCLGNPIGNVGIPFIVGTLAVGMAIKPFKDEMHGLLLAGLYIGGSLLLTLLLVHFYVAFNGKRILGAIEKDYGPRTRESVFKTFAEGKEGDKIDLDIPAIARAYGESK